MSVATRTVRQARPIVQKFLKRRVYANTEVALNHRFPKETGLPMMVYLSGKQRSRPPCIEVSQYYDLRIDCASLFSVTVPASVKEHSRIIGDTGEILPEDVWKVIQFARQNSAPLLNFWYDEPFSREPFFLYENVKPYSATC